MIAVLPFDNLGAPADAFFAAGITDELTSLLGSVRGLGVISRTSAAQYASTKKSTQQIGEELGVEYLVEGAVKRDKARVHVVLRLIRVHDAADVWSGEFDGRPHDVFSVQREIASQVLRELNIKLRGNELKMLESTITGDVAAYEAYLHGVDSAHRSYAEKDMRQAVRYFEQAVKLDPNFATAWSRLAIANAYLYHVGWDRTQSRLTQAQAAADRAAAIDSDLPLTHVARGYLHYWGALDYPSASAELALAWKDLPNDAEVLEAIAYVRRRQGDFDQSLDDLRSAATLDPQNSTLLLNLGQSYLMLRRFDDALATYDKLLAIAPDLPLGHAGRSEAVWMSTGVVDEKPLPVSMRKSDDESAVGVRFHDALYRRDYDGALRVLNRSHVRTFLLLHVEQSFVPRELLIGDVQRLRGNNAAAKKAYAAAKRILLAAISQDNDDARLYSSLGLAYAGLGDSEDAIKAGKTGTDLLPVSKDALSGSERLLDLAKIYALAGETKSATDTIESLLNMPSLLSPGMLRLDPAWDSLRRDDAFKRLSSQSPAVP